MVGVNPALRWIKRIVKPVEVTIECCGRSVSTQVKALMFCHIEGSKQIFDQTPETALGEVVTRRFDSCQPYPDLPIRVGEAPGVQFATAGLHFLAHLIGIRRHDHELAGRVDDLRGGRQFKRLQQFERRTFSQQGDLE